MDGSYVMKGVRTQAAMARQGSMVLLQAYKYEVVYGMHVDVFL